MSQKSPEELELLKKCDKVWNVLEVLNILQALVDKSGIVQELETDGGARWAVAWAIAVGLRAVRVGTGCGLVGTWGAARQLEAAGSTASTAIFYVPVAGADLLEP